MIRAKLVSIISLSYLFKRVFDQIGNISSQNKDIGVVSLGKACLIQAVLKNVVAKKYFYTQIPVYTKLIFSQYDIFTR